MKSFFNYLIVILIILICSYGCNDIVVNQKKPPNVIILLSDDQGWGDLSITGNSNISTPNIDKLANEGAFFERFFVSPVCSPTRAELLTGRYHARMGVHSTSQGGERIDLDEVTIADAFKNAGYSTAMFGKWHNGMQYPYHPNGRGFNEFYGFCSGHWGSYFSPMLEHNGELVKGNGYVADDFTNRAIDFIDNNKDKPFLIYLAYNTPHSPMQVPDLWWNKFSDKKLELFAGENYNEDTLFTKAALAMCENIDWNVGRIIDKLESTQIDQNTIVIYFTDNGPNSWRWNDSLKGRKGSVDEGGVKSPFFIKYPKVIKRDKRIATISSVIDVFPTLLDLTGVECKLTNPLDGVSLVPLLSGLEIPDRYIFSHWNGKTSVRNQQYIYNNNGELYDVSADPQQLKDINNSNKWIADKLAIVLDEWEEEVQLKDLKVDNRPFPLGHPDYIVTQLPARDGQAHGKILRSDNSPNCTFFTNWIDLEDHITWNVDVLEAGKYEVELYYTCAEQDKGVELELSIHNNKLSTVVNSAHDPPLKGMENDRIVRTQSYVKEFSKMAMGTIHLDEGKGNLKLRATKIPGVSAIDFRLLNFRKIK